MTSSSPSQDTFQLHHQTKRIRNKMPSNLKQPPILQIFCDDNIEQPFPERTLKPDPAGHPILIGRASTLDKESKNSSTSSALANPENAKFVCSVMSRTHAQLTWINNRPYLQDTGSTHGTWYMPSSKVQLSPPAGRHASLRPNPRAVWQKIPNSLPLYDGIIIRFGRAITNPDNGFRHTPLQVTFRIPKLTNTLQPGTYGLNDSQRIDSSDESEVKEDDPQEAQTVKIVSEDSPRTTITSNKESSQAHPHLQKSLDHSGTGSTISKAPANPLKPSKRSGLSHASPNSARSADHPPSQTSKRFDVSGHNNSFPPPYDNCQSPSPKKLSVDPLSPTELDGPNHSHLDMPDETKHNPNHDRNRRGHQGEHGNMRGAGRVVVEEESRDAQQDTSNMVKTHDNEDRDTKKDHLDVLDKHSEMEEEDSDFDEESGHVKHQDTNVEEDSEDEEDSRDMGHEQYASRFENPPDQDRQPHRQQNKAIVQNNEAKPRETVAASLLDDNQRSSESSPTTSTEEVSSLMTIPEEGRGTKKQKNQLSASSSFKDVSVVTTITSKTKFTESLNRLPDGLGRTFQSPKLNRLVQSEPGNLDQPYQIPQTGHHPASSESQSPVVTNDGTMITTELKRKRSSLTGDEKEQVEEQTEEQTEEEDTMDSMEITECEKVAYAESDGTPLKKRVKLANDDENNSPIVCSYCSNEINDIGSQPQKRKFTSHVLSAAKSVAIFALGGVATVAGILAFENIADEQ